MKTVIELAVQAGWIREAGEPDTGCLNLECFADLMRADEREACAEIDFYELLRSVCNKEQAEECANLISTAIRARSNK